MSANIGTGSSLDDQNSEEIRSPATIDPPADAPVDSKSWLKHMPLLVVLTVTLLVFLPILNFPFSTIDDGPNVFANPLICKPDKQHIWYLWEHVYNALYTPLTSTIWALCARIAPLSTPVYLKLGGSTVLNPYVFHTASLILHLANIALVYALLRRLTFTPLACAAGSAVFALHPMQVESVAWITGSNNLIAAFFSLITLHVYFAAAISSAGLSTLAPRTRNLLVLATIAYAAALLSKPTAVVVPLIVVVCEIGVLGRPVQAWNRLVALWLAMALILVIVTQIADSHVLLLPSIPLWWRPFVAGDSLAFYLGKLVAPFDMPVDYARRPDLVMARWWGYATWMLPFGIGCLLWRLRSTKLSRWIMIGILITTVGLLPNLGLVVSYGQENSTVADRYIYLPMLGIAVVCAALLTRYRANKAFLVGFTAVLALLSARTVAQIRLWGNVDLLAETMVLRSPYSKLGHLGLGLLKVADNDLPGALVQFETDDKLQKPPTALAKLYIGTTLIEMNRQADAVAPLTEAFRLSPSDGEVWYQLWNILAYLNRYDEAEAVVRRHLVAVPSDADAKFALAKLLLRRNAIAEAIPLLEQSEVSLPNVGAIPFFLGSAYEKLNQSAEAVKYYRRAAELDPSNPEIKAARERLSEGAQAPANKHP